MKLEGNTPMKRRAFLKGSLAFAAGATVAQWKSALAGSAGTPKVVVIGGGFAGATAAKYLKIWGGNSVDVTLVEPKLAYYTPILSNEVLTGEIPLTSLRFTYAALQTRYGVIHRQNTATAIDPAAQIVTLDDGTTLNYDRLIVAPGISFKYPNSYDTQKIPAAWQGGQEVMALRQKLQAMTGSDTFVMTIPPAPYRCPPGPYERACVVSDWLARNRPGAQVLVLDANPDSYLLWNGIFKNIFPSHSNLTRIGNAQLVSVDDTNMAVTVSVNGQTQTHSGAVINVIPPMRAGAYALLSSAGLVLGDWAPVHGETFESKLKANVHIIGDAQAFAEVPKAGHVANAEAKVCASAVLRLLNGIQPYSDPRLTSACFSPTDSQNAIWISEMFHLDANGDYVLNPLGVNQPPTWGNKQAMYNWSKNLFGDVFM